LKWYGAAAWEESVGLAVQKLRPDLLQRTFSQLLSQSS
jgi:hypothetical protein